MNIRARFAHAYHPAALWTSENPVLLAGETGIESDTGQKKIGDGTTPWNDLDYDASGGFTGNIGTATGNSLALTGGIVTGDHGDFNHRVYVRKGLGPDQPGQLILEDKDGNETRIRPLPLSDPTRTLYVPDKNGIIATLDDIQTLSTTVASLPSAATVGSGARAFVTDSNSTTFLAIVAGGGSNKVPVVSDGANWLIG